LATALVAAGTPVAIVATAGAAEAVSNGVVISQVYGGGGNSGATLKNDFIELFNRGTTTVSLTGWSVQYASATGTSWSRTNLSGSIPAGGYYLVQQAQGTGGTVDLPTPDATGTIAMSGTAGKVALVSSTTSCAGTTCTGVDLIDFVGFGTTANASETAPTANLSNTTAALRGTNGCTETDNNSTDFSTGTPAPRNSASPLNPCGPVTPTPGVTVSPTTVSATEGGATGSFTVVLGSQPTADVTFAVTPDAQVTTSVNSLTFTNANWNTAQSVTVTAVDDAVVEGPHNGTVVLGAVTSTDPAYAGINPADVTVTITDNDSAPVACAAVDTPIGSVQGSGATVAITGPVTVQGVVVGDYEGVSPAAWLLPPGSDRRRRRQHLRRHLRVQLQQRQRDLGDVVRVTGTAGEFQDQTQISG
jgi:predicted extracellular nuclease